MGRFPHCVAIAWCGLLVGSWATPAAALQGPRPLDLHWEAASKVRIEWKADWEATYKANVERWTGEVAKLTGDRSQRGRLLRVRVVKLLEALIARYPKETKRHLAARLEIAGNLYSCYLRGRGAYALKGVVEGLPGEPGIAFGAFDRILREGIWERPWEVEEGAEWAEYAARRLIALHRCGQVPDGHPSLVRAWRSLAMLMRMHGRLLDAQDALAALEVHSGRDEWWLTEEAALLLATGRDAEALPLFQELYGRNDQNSRARDLIGDIERYPPGEPATFPNDFVLEMRWDAVRTGLVAGMAARIHDLLQGDAARRNLAPWDDGRQASVWALLDEHVRSQERRDLGALRQAQERGAAELLAAARKSPTSDALLALYRSRPWARASHDGLLLYGEDALRRGRCGLALRAFRDVLSHAVDGGLRAKAQAGEWLALAQLGRPGRLAGAFEGVAEDAPYPWLGGREAAARIRDRLKVPAAQAEAPPLSALARRTLVLPPVSPWQQELLAGDMPRELAAALAPQLIRPVVWDGGILVAGPDLLACFGQGAGAPVWTCAPVRSKSHQGKLELDRSLHIVLPGPFAPAVAGERVYTRWGLDRTRRFMTGLAAFDVRTGRMAWSTARDPAWSDIWPIGNPAVNEGRLYVLGLQKGYSSVVPVATVSLLCLDADSGRLVWQSDLGSQAVTLLPHPRSPYNGRQFDPVHYGGAATVCEGAVYCSTNMGFVARCDARDGLVEWASTYPRTTLRGVEKVAQRLGSAPVVADGRVLVLPRDCQGVVAFECSTGMVAWDSPAAPSSETAGLADGLLVVNDSRNVAALDVATGRSRWHRHVADGIVGRPCLMGGSLLVATQGAVLRLDAASGRTLERGEWGTGKAMKSPVVSGRSLVGLADDALRSPREPVKRPLNPRAPSPAALQLPVQAVWKLKRPNPRIFVPTPEAKLDGRLYVVSQGVLECVSTTPQGAVEWQRSLDPGYRTVEWAAGMLLLAYPSRVDAVDGKTGKLLWRTSVPFRIRAWHLAPPNLVLGDYGGGHRSRRTGVVELATGKLLWHRRYDELGDTYHNRFCSVMWDGKVLHAISDLTRDGGGAFDVVLRPSDGTMAAIRRLRPKGKPMPPLLATDRGWGVYVDKGRVAYQFGLDGRPHTRYRADLGGLSFDYRASRHLRIAGQWVLLHQYEEYPHYRHIHWILRRDDPAYVLRRPRHGVVRGDRLYEVDKQTLRVADLPSRKEVSYAVRVAANHQARILEYREEGNRMLVVSGVERGPYASRMTPFRIRVDAFDRATGKHVGEQVLDDTPYWRYVVRRSWSEYVADQTQVAWAKGLLLITDEEGVSALVAAPPGQAPADRRVHVAFESSAPIVPDGVLDDWRSAETVAVRSRRGGAELRLAHDDAHLYIALRYPCGAPAVRLGRGAYGAGDWLEVGLTTRDGSFRWGIGADGRHRAVCDDLGSDGVAQAVRGAVRHDQATGRLTFEMAVPLAAVIRKRERDRWRKIGLSLAVWEDGPDADPSPALAWGGALEPQRFRRDHHEVVYLHSLTRERETAGLAIAHELPELAEGWEFFKWTCGIRTLSGHSKALLERGGDYLKRHRTGLVAERALVWLGQALRTNGEADPTPALLALASKAGVEPAVRNRYAVWTKLYLSQWVHIDPKKPALNLMIQLHDGTGERGWEHRVFWGHDAWRDWGTRGTPSRQRAGPIPHEPGWHELRVPLTWVGMHDTPIHGISFAQYGGGNVVWDRTAIVGPGLDKVLVDDGLPKGKVAGNWRWVSNPRRSGARAHAEGDPGGLYTARHRSVAALAQPIADHVQPRTDGPMLSQWVHIDRAKRARMVSLSLAPRGDSYFRVLWGEALAEGRPVGALPGPGQWHELRLPLAWTPFAFEPIHGIAFGQFAGRVVWDRTAIVNGGREQLWIDDDQPAGSARGTWQWVEKPLKSGKKAHTHEPSDAYSSHGIVYVAEPVTSHLSFDGERGKAVLRRHIPALGPTGVAWHFFQALHRVDHLSAPERVDHYKWFLATMPGHPRSVSMLKSLFDSFKRAEQGDPVRAVEAIIAECKVPRSIRYEFRRKYLAGQDTFIRTWRLIGPFPNPDGRGLKQEFPPETEPVRLDKSYPVVGDAQASWQFHRAPKDMVDLAAIFKPNEHVVAYAVCWLYSKRGRFVSLELGSDDGVKVWVNRKVVHENPIERSAETRQDTVAVRLRPGWNELLVKVEQGEQLWSFCVELLDREARGLLKEVTVSTIAPKGSSGR